MSVPVHERLETLLKVEGVDLALGGKQILRDVNVEIKNIVRPGMTQGQVVGFLGPSGMGKTRLFRILAGLDKPDAGHVLVGKDQKEVERGMVGVVAQNYPLFEHRTVISNLVVAGKLGGLSSEEAEAKAHDLLSRFDMSGHEKKYPAQLSGGMRQRIAIAQQFMCSEHFLLMDEPFSGLDPLAVDRVIHFIQEVAASDEMKTIIVVTHDVEAAVSVSDTIWLLGRDRDAKGEPIPGARIQATYDLIEKELAWQPHVADKPEFHRMCRDIREAFPRL